MRKYFERTNAPAVLILVGFLLLIGYQSFAYRPPATSHPAVIATFDLERTFNALNEKKDADSSLLKMAEDMNKKTEERSKALKQMEVDLEDLQPGTEKHQDLINQWSLASQEYKAQVEFYKLKIDSERARTLRKIYQSIRAAVEQLAVEQGYDVVFVDDSVAEIPPGSEQEINRQISSRRIVYSSPVVDATDILIERMNKAYTRK